MRWVRMPVFSRRSSSKVFEFLTPGEKHAAIVSRQSGRRYAPSRDPPKRIIAHGDIFGLRNSMASWVGSGQLEKSNELVVLNMGVSFEGGNKRDLSRTIRCYLFSAHIRLCPREVKRTKLAGFPTEANISGPLLITDTEEDSGSIPVSPTILWPRAPLG